MRYIIFIVLLISVGYAAIGLTMNAEKVIRSKHTDLTWMEKLK